MALNPRGSSGGGSGAVQSYLLCAINGPSRFPGLLRALRWAGVSLVTLLSIDGRPDLEHAVEPLPRTTTDADPHAHDEDQHRDRQYTRRSWRHRKSLHALYVGGAVPRRSLVVPGREPQLYSLCTKSPASRRPNTLTGCARRSNGVLDCPEVWPNGHCADPGASGALVGALTKGTEGRKKR